MSKDTAIWLLCGALLISAACSGYTHFWMNKAADEIPVMAHTVWLSGYHVGVFCATHPSPEDQRRCGDAIGKASTFVASGQKS